MHANVTDMTRGVYRRLYAGARTGKRINQVSVEAELLFWRLHCVADDFGNLPGDPYLVRIEAVPLRREWDDLRVSQLLDELVTTVTDRPLVSFYDAAGERFIHISDFLNRQPGNRSGRRIRKYPPYPFEQDETRGETGSGESWGILGNPGESSAPQNQSHTQNQSESESENHTHPQTHSQSENESQAHSRSGESGGPGGPATDGLADIPGGEVGLSSISGNGGVGGLGPAIRRSLGPDYNRQIEVQSELAKIGVTGDVQRELYQRKDIMPELVRRERAKVQKCKDVDDLVAVLVHRLRNYGR